MKKVRDAKKIGLLGLKPTKAKYNEHNCTARADGLSAESLLKKYYEKDRGSIMILLEYNARMHNLLKSYLRSSSFFGIPSGALRGPFAPASGLIRVSFAPASVFLRDCFGNLRSDPEAVSKDLRRKPESIPNRSRETVEEHSKRSRSSFESQNYFPSTDH